MMQIPIWLMVLLVMWCISYIVLVIRFFTVYERELSEMREEYAKMYEKARKDISCNQDAIVKMNKFTAGFCRKLMQDSDLTSLRLGAVEREILELGDRLKSLESGFELLRNEQYAYIDVSEGAEVWAISDGALHPLHKILDTDGNSENLSEKSDENSSEKSGENSGEGTDETE